MFYGYFLYLFLSITCISTPRKIGELKSSRILFFWQINDKSFGLFRPMRTWFRLFKEAPICGNREVFSWTIPVWVNRIAP